MASSKSYAVELVEATAEQKPLTVSASDINLIEMPSDVLEVHTAKGKKVTLEVKGEKVYLRTAELQPFSLYIECEDIVYSYLITPSQVESKHIRVVDRYREAKEQSEAIKNDRLALIRNMMSVMIGGTPFTGLVWEGEKKETTASSKNIQGMLTGTWEGQVLGIRYDVRNISENPVMLFEEDFWSPGVLAVALEKDILQPGESVKVYLVKTKRH